ncbi:MAG: exopolysaccharide transport family protein, partial [Parerythrobacter sp.]
MNDGAGFNGDREGWLGDPYMASARGGSNGSGGNGSNGNGSNGNGGGSGGGAGTGDGASFIDFDRLYARARSLRYVLIGIIVGSLLLGLLVTLLQTPRYAASARIEISRVDVGTVDIDGAGGAGGGGVEVRDTLYFETQYELLRSRFLAERVVEASDIASDPAFREAYAIDEGQDISDDAAAGIARSAIEIVPVEGSTLVDVIASTPSGRLSAELANAWAEQYLDANYEKRFGNTRLARQRLERQLDEMRVRLEESEADLIAYANANELVVLEQSGPDGEGTRSTLVSQELSALSGALAGAQSRRVAAQSALEAGAGGDQGGSLRGQIAGVKAQIAQLSTQLGPQNPQIVALNEQLASLRASLGDAGGVASAQRQAAYQAALNEERTVRSDYNDARRQFLTQQDRGVQYGILEREVNTNSQLYNALLEQYKQLDVVSAGANNVTLIEQATPPGSPSSPYLPLNLGIALALGLIACGAIVYIVDLTDSTIRDPGDVTRLFDVPVLGLIPAIRSDDPKDELANSFSVLSESYASTWTSLTYALGRNEGTNTGTGTGTDRPLSLMITSTRPAEGKTLTSFALARTIARLGSRVILIDMDLRRMGLSALMEQRSPGDGMSEFLSGKVDAPRIHQMDEHGFAFIGAGKLPADPVGLLSGPRTRGYLDELKRDYDA